MAMPEYCKNARESPAFESMETDDKPLNLSRLIDLAQMKRLQECLNELYNAYKHTNVSSEDTHVVIAKVVHKVRQDVKESLCTVGRDPILCSLCYSILYKSVTFPCGHTYCGNCSHRQTCRVCSEKFPISEHKRNVIVARITERYWASECKAIALRNEGNARTKQKNYDEALRLYDQALQIYPNDHIALANRSHALLCLRRTNDALRDADLAVTIRPMWARGHSRRSSALLALGYGRQACAELLLCAALCSSEQCSQYTADLAELIHKLLLEESTKNQNWSSTASPSSGSLPSTSVDHLRRYSCTEPDVPIKCSIPPGDQLSKPSSHFKKLWKDRSLEEFGSAYHTHGHQTHFLLDMLDTMNQMVENVKERGATSTPLPASQRLQLDEVECSLCMRLLWQPISTPCGHTFCRTCLVRSLDHRHYCPLCKASLKTYLAERRFLINDFIEAVIQRLFGEEYLSRQKQVHEELDSLCAAGRDSSHPFPIFVATVALPLMDCPLHVFEPRYKLMIRRCMESGTREFGMCGSLESGNGYYEYGATLEIRDIRYLPDGRSILNTVGKRRFKVLHRSHLDGYNVATVDFIEDEMESDDRLAETQKLHDKMRRSVELWFRRIPAVARDKIVECCGEMPPVEHRYWTKPHGPDWLWWLATMLPLHNLAKHSLLGMVHLRKRLMLLYYNFLQFLKDRWTMGIPRQA